MTRTPEWADNLLYAVNSYKTSYIRHQLRTVMGDMTGELVRFTPKIQWTIQKARRRIKSVPLDIHSLEGKPLAILWVQRQPGLNSNGGLTMRYGDEEPILAIKLEPAKNIDEDTKSVWHERGFRPDWYPIWPINEDELQIHRRVYIISQDMTVIAKKDFNGTFVLEGEVGDTSRIGGARETIQMSHSLLNTIYLYESMGVYSPNIIDHIMGAIEVHAAPPLRRFTEYLEQQEILPLQTRMSLRRGPWRNVGQNLISI